MPEEFPINQALATVKKAVRGFRTPSVTVISQKHDPFAVLVSCIISLRTRDEVTETASTRLLGLANSPEKLLKLSKSKIEKAIYPAAFYRNKTQSLKEICKDLVDIYEGEVPDKLEELLKLKGVGRKTANLTLTLGHDKPGICVDIHVHRISNRWGYVKTKSPDETEKVLRNKLPRRFWKGYNDLLVTFGQNICKPVSPFCGSCPIAETCPKNGVTSRRH
ncbi:MAG: endonuclease III [Nitrospina sp.]|nr:endonuclease III [Nitrospina sp.]MBT3510239.1 endonuclease III [Nitrospina sp.]MBT3876792.1 endonuclease III [Nitrospina sp.]MBT4048148.1 endonuclease III [Nitrospina sp.]MBT4556834.1 endonuclease III [Nitrospina sp.]